MRLINAKSKLLFKVDKYMQGGETKEQYIRQVQSASHVLKITYC